MSAQADLQRLRKAVRLADLMDACDLTPFAADSLCYDPDAYLARASFERRAEVNTSSSATWSLAHTLLLQRRETRRAVAESKSVPA